STNAEGDGPPQRPRTRRGPSASSNLRSARDQALLTDEPGVAAAERRGLRQRASRFALDLTPLRRSPAFRRLWFAQGLSFIGTEIAEVALAYQMYQLTGSKLAVGLISLTHLVPLLTLTVIGGAIADAVDRRRLMLVQQLGMIVGSLGLAANAATDNPRVWALYAS